jgi:hypothetical protein
MGMEWTYAESLMLTFLKASRASAISPASLGFSFDFRWLRPDLATFNCNSLSGALNDKKNRTVYIPACIEVSVVAGFGLLASLAIVFACAFYAGF